MAFFNALCHGAVRRESPTVQVSVYRAELEINYKPLFDVGSDRVETQRTNIHVIRRLIQDSP